MNRRRFMAMLATTTLAGLAFVGPVYAQASPPASVQTPEQIVRWIYAEAVKKDRHGSQNGGTIFGTGNRGPIRRLFSAGFLREWDAAQARLKKSGDMGLDFDPVSNSQDPSIGKTEFRVETNTDARVTVAAIFGSLEDAKAAPQTVRYDFLREGNAWKIDNLRGNVEADPWDLRKIMKEW